MPHIRIKVISRFSDLKKVMELIACETGFIPELNKFEIIGAQAPSHGVHLWWVHGTGSPDLVSPMIHGLEVLSESRDQVCARPLRRMRISVYGHGQQALNGASNIERTTAFVLDSPLRSAPHTQGTRWFYGMGPSDLKHEAIYKLELLDPQHDAPSLPDSEATQRN